MNGGEVKNFTAIVVKKEEKKQSDSAVEKLPKDKKSDPWTIFLSTN
jgi:hypothetical protein